MSTKMPAKNISINDAYAPPVPAATAAVRDPLEPLTVYSDGTLVLPRQLTHDNIAREVKLVNLAKELKPDFEGVETEDNWGRRETNIIILRKITNSTVPEERTSVYISTFRGLLDGIVKSATSLRTSLSLQGTTLIQEAARTVGPGIDQTFDILYPALEKQSLTKPAQAQAANNAMIALLTHLTFHSRILDSLSTAMESKNKALRGYVLGWLESLIRHCAKSTLESHIDVVEKILRKGLSDADGVVREKSRAVFWTYAGKLKTRGDIMYESLPKQSQKSLDAANGQGVLIAKPFDSSLNRGPPPPRPATSHADRSSLKQFIKDKKKETKKVESSRPLVERPKSAAPGQERKHEISSSIHSIRKPARGAEALSRPGSAASTHTIDRAHGKQSSQDLKRGLRKQIDPTDDQFTLLESTRAGAGTPHGQRKAVRRLAERPDSGIDRPKSSASTASTTAPMKAVRPTPSTVFIRPKMATSAATSGTGTLSSAPKRPNFNRKAVTSANISSITPTINTPIDYTTGFAQDLVPAHIAHVITPPRGIQDPLPLQVLPNPPHGSPAAKELQGGGYMEDAKPNHKTQQYGSIHDKTIDPRSISSGTLNVMASLISDASNTVPSDAFEVLSTALEQGDVHIRRAAMDLGIALWKRVDDPMVFWSQLEELEGKTKSFIMYWINKEKQTA